MIGLFASILYTLCLWAFSEYGWQSIYVLSTTFLFKWYFISSALILLMLLPLAVISSGALGFLAFAYKTAEMMTTWIGVTINSGRSLLRFILKRAVYILGAYYLHVALVFDEDKMPAYRWDKEYLIAGTAFLLTALLFFTKKSVKIKLRGQKTNNPPNKREILRF